ncbi:MAG: DUF2461 domain-containing protein [marine benthic group bacterium]|jgi:uncharacterized protein (TIGR02453 family)|nr:DUF2461 domain-containing protein [Gemmatimonadota bacterium]MCL7967097.1 DUF2461 domain-containing protein [Gemmatimonadota bacterium]MCL7969100.1 DUF2461 domain-containing protein [Gemmatimonadota bacterium]MCL7973956.1 DUF2461 domain-containing protein [Gemmatimonadota bacterium]MCL7980988.1 DUF2461 domain-containing protein [Gemmatimonadota bacterium]
MAEPAAITPALFTFLRDLKSHNERAWFEEHRARFERDVREPLLAFIASVQEPLAGISPSILAIAKKQGGSLFRIHRDIRFSKDKSPYKTWAALQFRHEAARDVHAPGYYLHLEPDNSFAAAGIWRPARDELERVREAMVEEPDRWTTMRDGLEAKGWAFGGEALKRVPRGVDPDHPLADDLKRKDYIVSLPLDEGEICRSDFPDRYLDLARSAAPLPEYLCRVLGLAW